MSKQSTTTSIVTTFSKLAVDALFHPQYGWKTTHFWAPAASWGIVLAGVYDMSKKGPEMIFPPITVACMGYSTLFIRFAWMISPRNYLLLVCHVFNAGVQAVQLGRRRAFDQAQARQRVPLTTDQSQHGITKPKVIAYGLFALGGATAFYAPRFKLQTLRIWPNSMKPLLEHPAGPFTVFFWAPIMKWGLSIANIIDFKRPVDTLSVPQQLSLALTGGIWTRYCFVITPVNYSLALVNSALMFTGLYQLTRKLIYDPFKEEEAVVEKAV